MWELREMQTFWKLIQMDETKSDWTFIADVNLWIYIVVLKNKQLTDKPTHNENELYKITYNIWKV